jgi:hypothetical protein
MLGMFVYWYGPVRTGTKSIRLLVLFGSYQSMKVARCGTIQQ